MSASTGSEPIVLASGQDHPYGIVAEGDFLYWTNYGEAPSFDVGGELPAGHREDRGAVMAMRKDGTSLVTLAPHQHQPNGIAATSTHVFWTSYGLRGGGAVWKVERGGGEPTRLAAGLRTVGAIAVAGRHAVFVSFFDFMDDDVMRVPIEGGEVTTLASRQNPAGIALFGAEVYWTNFVGGQVMRVPVQGGQPQEVTRPEAARRGMTGIAVRDGALYCTNAGDAGGSGGTVLTMRTDGTGSRMLARDQRLPFRIAVDERCVYWTNMGSADKADGAIMSVPIDGGTPAVLASGQRQPIGIAVDDAAIYWVNLAHGSKEGQVMALAKPPHPARV
ncbi:DUF5050 domain-containing protein [Sorangium sp. So ce385]|uniref:DUF5050 domain-containing protein n=1 Tax=Sorangium sp. So ce385 TaxID=3133308 RepID=UPI003F5C0793